MIGPDPIFTCYRSRIHDSKESLNDSTAIWLYDGEKPPRFVFDAAGEIKGFLVAARLILSHLRYAAS